MSSTQIFAKPASLNRSCCKPNNQTVLHKNLENNAIYEGLAVRSI